MKLIYNRFKKLLAVLLVLIFVISCSTKYTAFAVTKPVVDVSINDDGSTVFDTDNINRVKLGDIIKLLGDNAEYNNEYAADIEKIAFVHTKSSLVYGDIDYYNNTCLIDFKDLISGNYRIKMTSAGKVKVELNNEWDSALEQYLWVGYIYIERIKETETVSILDDGGNINWDNVRNICFTKDKNYKIKSEELVKLFLESDNFDYKEYYYINGENVDQIKFTAPKFLGDDIYGNEPFITTDGEFLILDFDSIYPCDVGYKLSDYFGTVSGSYEYDYYGGGGYHIYIITL